MRNDTIAAIATARGTAALAIVRLSGSGALLVADRCFRGRDRLADIATHTVRFGRISGGDEAIDQVVATVFRGPASATGEDVVEFSCHGGAVTARRVLETLLAAGARMAEPGEFTQRAFVNGRIDLVQAEAVADMIHARSTAGHRAAVRQLEGRASERLARIRDELLDGAGYIELEQDFSEEDVEFADRSKLDGLLAEAAKEVAALLGTPRRDEVLRDAVRIVIGGRPNAGKSTLLNALVGYDRAIVNHRAGTTRDLIEAELEIEGFLFRFVDTAGLRDTADDVENEGVLRAERAIADADALIYVVDGTVGMDQEEMRAVDLRRLGRPECAVLLVENKVDAGTSIRAQDLEACGIPSSRFVRISAAKAVAEAGELGPLQDVLLEAVRPLLTDAESAPMVVNGRQRQHLVGAAGAIDRARAGLDTGVTGDLLALDLRFALSEIGSLTGAVSNEDVLDRIFSRFCIGK